MNNCNLTINKKLEIKVNNDGKNIIVRKDNNKEIATLNKKIIWLEEISKKSFIKDIIKLISISYLSREKVYFIEEILIDLNTDKNLISLIALTMDKPFRLYKDVYKYRDLDNKLCILNLRTNSLTRIENNIKNKFKSIGLEVTNVKLNSIENNNNVYELVIKLKDSEILHIVLRIDNEINFGYEVSNTIYSEYYNGLEFNVSNKFKSNEFIDGDIFFESLINHPLWIELLKNKPKLLDDTKNVQTNIRVRIMSNKYKEKGNI